MIKKIPFWAWLSIVNAIIILLKVYGVIDVSWAVAFLPCIVFGVMVIALLLLIYIFGDDGKY